MFTWVITKSITFGDYGKVPFHWKVASSLNILISMQTVSQTTHAIAKKPHSCGGSSKAAGSVIRSREDYGSRQDWAGIQPGNLLALWRGAIRLMCVKWE